MALSGSPPAALPARSGMIETLQFTPVTPSALLPRAPIVPATCEPCSLASSGTLSFETKSQPCVSSTNPLPSESPPPGGSSFVQMLSARSGWSYATPVSITPTTMSGLPVVRSQASGASMSLSLAWLRPQSWPKLVSFGIAAVRRT